MTDDSHDSTDDSRRSLAKQGTVAAGALSLGTGTLAGTAAAQNDDEEVVIFGADYLPGVTFDVVGDSETMAEDAVPKLDTERARGRTRLTYSVRDRCRPRTQPSRNRSPPEVRSTTYRAVCTPLSGRRLHLLGFRAKYVTNS